MITSREEWDSWEVQVLQDKKIKILSISKKRLDKGRKKYIPKIG